MFKEKIPPKRLRAWVIASAIAPCAMFSGGSVWVMVLFAALACGGISVAVQHFCSERSITAKWYAFASWLWLSVLLGSLARYSADCWTDGQAYPAVPLILLALAGVNSQKGGEKASKAGAVLIWLVVLGLGIVLGAGIKELKLQWIKTQSGNFAYYLIPLLLLPALSSVFPSSGKRCAVSTSVCVGVTAVVISFCVNAGLSESYAAQTQNPLLEYCKSLSLFGTVERFESLVACALTAGWFSSFSLILSAAGCSADKVNEGWGGAGVWTCALAATAVMLTGKDISSVAVSIGSVLLWGVLPLLASILQYIRSRKDSRKLE